MDQPVIAAGAAAAALMAIVGFIRWVLPFLRRIGHFLDDWFGEAARPGHPANPGMPARMQSVEQHVERMTHELSYNGGSSIKDAVKRIERQQAEDRKTRAADREALNTLAALVGAFVGREQEARIEGRRAEGEMWRAVQEIRHDDESK